MTVAETLAALKSEKDIEPSADYAGEENTDDFILAIQTDKTKQTKEYVANDTGNDGHGETPNQKFTEQYAFVFFFTGRSNAQCA